MKTGPKAKSGFDISLTEVIDKDEHYFMMEEGSEKGSEMAAMLETNEAMMSRLKQQMPLLRMLN